MTGNAVTTMVDVDTEADVEVLERTTEGIHKVVEIDPLTANVFIARSRATRKLIVGNFMASQESRRMNKVMRQRNSLEGHTSVL